MDQKYLENLKIWCCRKVENIIWTDYVRKEILKIVK